LSAGPLAFWGAPFPPLNPKTPQGNLYILGEVQLFKLSSQPSFREMIEGLRLKNLDSTIDTGKVSAFGGLISPCCSDGAMDVANA
jgi:hypothetical protein